MVDATRLGETTSIIIQRYGLPIPVVYPSGSGGVVLPGLDAPAVPLPRAVGVGLAVARGSIVFPFLDAPRAAATRSVGAASTAALGAYR